MSRDHRPKASEIHRDAHYVFAQKVGFAEAFPEVEEVSIRVEERGRGAGGYRGGSDTRVRTFTKMNLGEYVDCSNTLCYNGGASVGSALREAVRERRTEFEDSAMCQGYEGSPKGQRKYRDCINVFTIRGTIKYREADA